MWLVATNTQIGHPSHTDTDGVCAFGHEIPNSDVRRILLAQDKLKVPVPIGLSFLPRVSNHHSQ
jgi:hypothetical protein